MTISRFTKKDNICVVIVNGKWNEFEDDKEADDFYDELTKQNNMEKEMLK